MPDWRIPKEAVEEHYQVLNTIGCLGDSPAAGFLRAAYSDEETSAMKYIESCAISLGATARWDNLGNLFLEWPGERDEFVEFGSHLDTVPFGGNYDGVAGVVAGLLAIERIIANLPHRIRGLRLRVWRGEESGTFNAVYIGSLGALGKFNARSLTNTFGGRSLEEAMRSQGIEPEFVRIGQATILQGEIDSIAAHMELHIEQGNVLEVQKRDVGIVTSIRGPRRLRITLKGEFDHSGATPMGVEYRRDCNLALGYIIVKLDELGKEARKEGADLVQTIGVINSSRDYNERVPLVYENAVPKVSGYCYFCLDVRSNNNKFLDSYVEQLSEAIFALAAQYRIEASIETIGQSSALEAMDSCIQSSLEEASKSLGLKSIQIASGAGHDTAIVGQQKYSNGTPVKVGMLFIPCRGGKSHSPDEFTSYESIANGASVLAMAGASLSK